MNQSILLVAPPTEQIATVCAVLKSFGFSVSQVENMNDIKAGLASCSPAFLLLDLDVKDSEIFLEETFGAFYWPRPFILASASFQKGAERTAILRLGADACIGKPVDAQEVLAVIYAIQRRESWAVQCNQSRLLPQVKYKDLVIDPFQRSVTMRGTSVELTPKEFDILYFLACHSGTVYTQEEIYEAVWKTEYRLTAASISGHIFSIRKKLGLNCKNKDYIQTVFGVGYRFSRSE